MKSKIILFCLASLCLFSSRSQQLTAPGPFSFYLSIADSTIISSRAANGRPVFTIPGINQIMGRYSISKVVRAFPDARFDYMRHVYKFTASSMGLARDLVSSYRQYFPYYEQCNTVMLRSCLNKVV